MTEHVPEDNAMSSGPLVSRTPQICAGASALSGCGPGPQAGRWAPASGLHTPHPLDAWPGPPSRHCPQQAPGPLHQDHNRLPHLSPIQPLGLKPRSLPPQLLTIPDRQVKGFSRDHTQTRHPDAITTGPELLYQMFPPVLCASIIAHLVIVCFLK